MGTERTLGEFEQIVLLAVLRLGDGAYGVTILEEIAARTGRNPAPGALYTTLHRMEDKGLVTFRDGAPTPERGGRAKRFVQVTDEGRAALASAQAAYRSLMEGLDLLPNPMRRALIGAAVLMLFSVASTPLAGRAQAVQGSVTGREPSKMMAPDATPAFDVASIKPANPAARPGRVALALSPTINTGPAALSSRSATVKDLIAAAYGIETYQVWGGPPWLESDRFEVLAKSDKPASRDQLLLMLRPLLKDRCKLAFHTETKGMRVYALTASKNVSLQRPLTPGEAAKPTLDRLVRNWDMPALARYLTRFGADMPVIDRPGLSGEFSLNLDMNSVVSAAYQNNGAAPTNENMFDATVEMIEHQTGLKLVRTNAPVEGLVIDRVDRPSAN